MKMRGGRAHPLLRLEHGLLELAFVALVAMNAVNVFARYVLHRSIGSLFEIMVLVSVCTYWLGIATAERTQSHLGMNFVTSKLSGMPLRTAEWVRLTVIAGFLLAAAYSSAGVAFSQYRSGAVAGTAGVPLWPFTAFIPLGCLLMLVRAVSHGTAGAPDQTAMNCPAAGSAAP